MTVELHHHHQQADDVLPHQPHHSIPQLDGNISPNEVQDRVWSCSCCEYKHFFETENELKKHHDTLVFTYEECNICYSHPIPQGLSIIILKPYVKSVTHSEKLEWWNILMVECVTILH